VWIKLSFSSPTKKEKIEGEILGSRRQKREEHNSKNREPRPSLFDRTIANGTKKRKTGKGKGAAEPNMPYLLLQKKRGSGNTTASPGTTLVD